MRPTGCTIFVITLHTCSDYVSLRNAWLASCNEQSGKSLTFATIPNSEAVGSEPARLSEVRSLTLLTAKYKRQCWIQTLHKTHLRKRERDIGSGTATVLVQLGAGQVGEQAEEPAVFTIDTLRSGIANDVTVNLE